MSSGWNALQIMEVSVLSSRVQIFVYNTEYVHEHHMLLQRRKRAKTLTEVEANYIAETIRGAALQKIRVETIEENPKGHTFQVRCRYNGPTFTYGRQLFLHGMPLYINKSYEWAMLYRLLNKS